MLTIIVTLIVLNVAIYAGRSLTGSGAAEAGTSSADAGRSGRSPRVSAPENCPDAKRAVRYYQRRYAQWRAKMGAGGVNKIRAGRNHSATACPRYLASVWKRKAYQARKAHERWHIYHWAWWKWLPYSWQARSRCELGYPLQPRSWRSNVYTSNGNFQGFVNFYDGTWDSYRRPGYPRDAWMATPRQQYEVALAVASRVGLGAWQSCATP